MILRPRKRKPTPYVEAEQRVVGVSAPKKRIVQTLSTEIPEGLLTDSENTLQQLGKGTFGECKIKIYKELYEVCVKYMKKESVSNQQLLAEASILTIVSGHEHIPHCFGVCLEQKALIMSLHLVDGAPLNLETALGKNCFHEKEYISFLLQVGDAIRHVHVKNIIHNDIKLNNIVLGKVRNETLPYLVDFGKACYMGYAIKYKLSKSEIDLYKKRYPQVAPDLRDGLVSQSAKSDVYSFGRIIKVIVRNTPSIVAESYRCLINATTKYNASERPDIDTVLTFLKAKVAKKHH